MRVREVGGRRELRRVGLAALAVTVFLATAGIGLALAQESSDGRAQVSYLEAIIADDGELWFKAAFYLPWDDKPPLDLFSFFFLLEVFVDGESSTIGWQVHDEEDEVISDGNAVDAPAVFILDDGCVLVATGLFPTEPFTADVFAAWGSWVDEATTDAVFGDDEFTVDSTSAVHGDPFVLLAPVVFDLVTGEMVMTTTTTTTATTSTTTTTAPTTTSTTVATTGGGTGSDEGAGNALPGVLIGIGLGLLGGGFFLFTRARSKDCEPERRAYAAADAAYEKAKRASDYWQGEYEHFRTEYNQYKGQTENRLPEPDRELGYPEGPDGDRAYADDLEHWRAQEEAAEIAEHNLEGARQAMEEAEANRDEADAALEAARDALERARIALRECEGSAPPSKGDSETPSGPPGTATPPPSEPAADCVEGATRTQVVSREKFQVLGGDIRINVPTTEWKRATNNGSLDGAQLGDLGQGDLEDLFADLDNRVEAVPISATIPTRVLTVKCIRTSVCSGGKWVATDKVERVEESSDGPDITFREKAKDRRLAARMVAKAQAKVAELEANHSSASDFACD